MAKIKYTAIVFYRADLTPRKYRNVTNMDGLLKWAAAQNPKLLSHINFYFKDSGKFAEQKKAVNQ